MSSPLLINWKEPLLNSFVKLFFKSFSLQSSKNFLKLDSFVIVVSSKRCARALQAALKREASREQKILFPPTVATYSQLFDLLSSNSYLPSPSLGIRLLCWWEAFKKLSQDEKKSLFSRYNYVLEEKKAEFYLSFFSLVDSLYFELLENLKDFKSVANLTEEEGLDVLTARFLSLDKLSSYFHQALKDLGFTIKQQEILTQYREDKLALNESCLKDTTFVLLSLSDMPLIIKELLRQCEKVVPVIHTAEEFTEFFDEFGCVRPDKWLALEDEILSDRDIFCFEKPSDEALGIVEMLDKFSAKENILEKAAVAAGNLEVVSHLEIFLSKAGTKAAYPEAYSYVNSPVISFIQGIYQYLNKPSWHSFKKLIRNPELGIWLKQTQGAEFNLADFYSSADLFFKYTYPAFISLPKVLTVVDSLEVKEEDKERILLFKSLSKVLLELLSPFLTSSEKPLNVLTKEVWTLVKEVFLRNSLEEEVVFKPLYELWQVLNTYANLEDKFKLSAKDFLHLIICEFEKKYFASQSLFSNLSSKKHIEIIGLLESFYQDAEILILSGLNDSFIPFKPSGEALLPLSLRKKLGLPDADFYLARDLYRFKQSVESHKQVIVTASRFSNDNEGLYLSRLLLRGNALSRAKRYLSFFKGYENKVLGFNFTSYDFPWPPIPESKPFKLSSLSVSQISDYLKCPYRFYLRHILQLSAEDDHLIELAPNFFSLLIHQVLFEFGRSALFKSTNENKIKEFLLLCLNKQVSNLRFLAMPTVKIQIKHLEQRLSMFSAWQAAQAKEWQIKEVEKSFNLPLAVYNSQEVELPVVKGRIDRVDIKKDSSEIIIIDYKATDKEINPVREHKVKGRWINAQLPLYWEFMRRQSKDLKIKTAYLLLLPSEVKLVEAKWQEEDLIEGVQSAVEAVEGIVKGSFWPPSLEEYSSFKEYDLFFSKGHYRGRGIK